ncbi:MAG: hypothetical protein ACRCX2_04825 [Paraclostridium sp.]
MEKREFANISKAQLEEKLTFEKRLAFSNVIQALDNDQYGAKVVYVVVATDYDPDSKCYSCSINCSLQPVDIRYLGYMREQYAIKRGSRKAELVNVTFESEFGIKLLSSETFLNEQLANAALLYREAVSSGDQDRVDATMFYLYGVRDTYQYTKVAVENNIRENIGCTNGGK